MRYNNKPQRSPFYYIFYISLILIFSGLIIYKILEKKQPPITVFNEQLNTSTSIQPKIVEDIPLPENYTRILINHNSFGSWLRKLSLKPLESHVLLYNGRLKSNQDAHFAVIDLKIGKKDLHQCADAVIHLHAKYLYSNKEYQRIHYNYTSGETIFFSDWAKGRIPVVIDNRVEWSRTEKKDFSYNNLEKYLENIYMYAGSYSLSQEMKKVSIQDMQIGDVFIQGGFPGHAVIVVDIAENAGKIIFLVAQSYMPAQEIHILKNPQNTMLSPWYRITDSDFIITPEWVFNKTDLMRFKN